MRRPKAVLIADVHYNINTLEIADKAMRMAIAKANELCVPFIVAGDLHDTKAMLRGECVKVMIDTFKTCKTAAIVLTGNHDRINEKSSEHSLEFLRKQVYLIDTPTASLDYHLIPYQSDSAAVEAYLDTQTLPGETLIMHQGVTGSNAGHYIQDKSACPKEWFADYRTVSGHYHLAQDIECGPPRNYSIGMFSYVGNPYTLNFGEANDGPKGFRILYDDGTLELVPTNLRKHVIIECSTSQLNNHVAFTGNLDALVWVKIAGARSELSQWNKMSVAERLMLTGDFKLDLIPIDDGKVADNVADKLSGEQLLDTIIDGTPESAEEKQYLKSLWRELLYKCG